MRDLPAEVLAAPQRIKPGNTKVHQHPDFEEIVQVMALYALSSNSRRLSLEKFTSELNKDFGGLEISREQVRQFLMNYVVPAIYIPPHWIKQGIVEAGHELNTVQQKLDIAEKLKRKFDQTHEDLSAKDAATLGKAALDAIEAAEDSLERYEMIPRAKTESVQTQVKVDVGDVIDKLKGRRVQDAEFRPKP